MHDTVNQRNADVIKGGGRGALLAYIPNGEAGPVSGVAYDAEHRQQYDMIRRSKDE